MFSLVIFFFIKNVLFSVDSFNRTSAYTPPKIEPFEVKNEPFLSYLPGSEERSELRRKLNYYRGTVSEIPIVIGGKHYTTGKVSDCGFSLSLS